MAATYGRTFVFGIPAQEKLLEIQNCFIGDQVIAEGGEFLKIARDGRFYAVEKLETGYSAFLLDEK